MPRAAGNTPASSQPPPGYADQRAVVLQILKDWKNPYSTSRGSAPDADTISSISTEGHSDGHWNLNAEVLRRREDTDEAHSHRRVAEELEEMRRTSPWYPHLHRLFLQDDAGDADYDHLKRKANDWGPESASARTLRSVNVAIAELTLRLIKDELVSKPPERAITTTHRTQTMEESYKELHRVFLTYCEELGRKMKRYRKRAYEATAVKMNVSIPTVERAVRFVEGPKKHRCDNHEKVSLRHKKAKA